MDLLNTWKVFHHVPRLLIVGRRVVSDREIDFFVLFDQRTERNPLTYRVFVAVNVRVFVY